MWKRSYADFLLRAELYGLRAELMQFDFARRSVLGQGALDGETGEKRGGFGLGEFDKTFRWLSGKRQWSRD